MENANQSTGSGLLSVRVTTGNGAIPIEGALVYVREYKNSSPVLYSLRTGNDGMTPTVRLRTPPRGDSLTPNGKVPFSEYLVTVKKEGFYGSENIGLPMFDGVTSVQKVDLLPLTEADIYSGVAPEIEYFENDGYKNLRGISTVEGSDEI